MLPSRHPRQRSRRSRLLATLAPLTALAALAALAAGCGPREDAPAPPPRLSGSASGYNLLLLSVDTVRADRLGAYGYTARVTTPRIDRLLASGVTFERAVAPRSITWPSLTSVLTGLYPSTHGVVENGYEIPDDVPTLPEVLRAAGYRTAAFLSNMCRANHRGWDDFACSGGRDGRTADAVLAWAADEAGRSGGGPPFFLWVHLFAAHGPYYNGGDLAERQLDPGYEGPVAMNKRALDRVMTEPIALTSRDVTHLDALYDAALMGTDHVVATILDGLEREGLLERTLLVFLADHGEELYDHNGYVYHACSVYESTLHVPLGITGLPDVTRGGRVSQPVELLDVAPTIYDLLGVTPPAVEQGVSLVPRLERPGAGGRGKPAFSDYGNEALRTVVYDGWKLIDNPNDLQPYCLPGAPQGHYPLEPLELYDLTADPEETRNLAAQEPERAAALERLIRRRFAGLARRGDKQELTPEMRKQLEALGYVAN